MRKLVLLLLVTTLTYSQSGIVTTGGGNELCSYTVGNNLVELQIPAIEEVTLGLPTYESPGTKPTVKPLVKKSFLEKLIETIVRIFKRKKNTV